MARVRTTRTKDERISEIDAKITYHKNCVAKLESQKERILNPKPRTYPNKEICEIISKAQENGLTEKDIAEKLGVVLD